MSASTPPTPPGWHPDPWGAATLRFWDGTQWTGYTSTTSVVTPAPTAVSRRSSDTARRCARWAMILLLAGTALSMFAITCIVAGSATTVTSPFGVALFVLGFVLSIPGQFTSWGVLILLAIWAYRIAGHGRALGIPARRSPGWAIGGWLIPIVSLWFPYESICDTLPPERRPRVLRWWLLYILGPLSILPALVCVGLSVFTGSALIVLAVGIVMTAGVSALLFVALRWGTEVADHIHAEQMAIAEAVGVLTD